MCCRKQWRNFQNELKLGEGARKTVKSPIRPFAGVSLDIPFVRFNVVFNLQASWLQRAAHSFEITSGLTVQVALWKIESNVSRIDPSSKSGAQIQFCPWNCNSIHQFRYFDGEEWNYKRVYVLKVKHGKLQTIVYILYSIYTCDAAILVLLFMSSSAVIFEQLLGI